MLALAGEVMGLFRRIARCVRRAAPVLPGIAPGGATCQGGSWRPTGSGNLASAAKTVGFTGAPPLTGPVDKSPAPPQALLSDAS